MEDEMTMCVSSGYYARVVQPESHGIAGPAAGWDRQWKKTSDKMQVMRLSTLCLSTGRVECGCYRTPQGTPPRTPDSDCHWPAPR